ncbi:MAG: thiol:disulfide interchange protein DsbA/DsbL [Pseudomonadota bacterium]|uniref:Thiol:disulfide interchange protein DsbA n=1 Tax=marine metagenome TaxID=408172 RepID=A0A381R4K3_9ZZZZ|nr:thiol:disulfide interchange protein DsbA/DsbL [Pseudomonadota bacterium]MEC8867487.1 thiol:disulfide interchange protein DsbA/DsbL [Pseudomonadota bacterium]MEC9286307.1 thiol:disulfide interchange protein DsbA/DsbL [Pseudomonadota bacterium]MEE3182747.1 thiol:disulfide interchange protein DsbA/DsbL [Pseudomonadota bacterium]HBP16109.1 disulfide bond formation protein DsbA [Gammaproteobacteria bacterium]|tara:strand:+ start:5938 stop:6621 length:684 start_codon:yes stop_codon:yes gene_type:complete
MYLHLNKAIVFAIVALSSAMAPAEEVDADFLGKPKFVEGQHYVRIPIKVETRDSEVIEVAEIFSYGCIHCFRFDPLISAWAAKDRDAVVFRRIPAVFGASWVPLAELYYAAEILGVLEEIHEPVFRAMHIERLDLRDRGAVRRIFGNYAGVDPQKFDSVVKSFTVRSRVQQGDALVRLFRVEGVPTMVVDGTYRVDGTMAGSNESMLEVVDFLIEKVRYSRPQLLTN